MPRTKTTAKRGGAGSKPSASSRRRRSKGWNWRLVFVCSLLGLGLAGLVTRLFTLQVLHGAEYSEIAQRQYESRAPLRADRGTIYDRRGTMLATSTPAISFAVDPRSVEDAEGLVNAFVDAFGGSPSTYAAKIADTTRAFVWIRRKVTGEAIEALAGLGDRGLIRLTEPLRRFEFASVGAQIIGCVNLDNVGLSGIELAYNEVLQGEDGYMVMQRDARGGRRPDVDLPRVDPEHGDDLELTIDITVQSIVEDELARGVAEAQASSGTVIALDPRTGEVLALASLPSFDPNRPSDANQEGVRPRGITDTYEPGSTMKAITAAAAIEEGVVEVADIIDGEGGELALGEGSVVRDDHPFTRVSFSEAFRRSSNVIIAKVAGRLDPSSYYRFVRDFGFGLPTGIDLPGEVRGEVKNPDDFGAETQAFMAYGYQLSITPLQLAAAYGAIANNGVLMKPYLVRRRITSDGEVIEEKEPTEVRRVISKETAAIVRDLLVDVVADGTGRAAGAQGITVAGKTGTAQRLHEGSYNSSRYNSSFVGFFPADDPRMVLLVLLNDPKNGYYGGEVAAPIFSAITRRVVNATTVDRRSGILQATNRGGSSPTVAVEAERTSRSSRIVVPDVRGLDVVGARALLGGRGLITTIEGEGSRVLRQEPSAGAIIDATRPVFLRAPVTDTFSKAPDLRGLAMRRALALAASGRLEPRIKGSGRGRVVRQDPPAGRPIDPSTRTITIWSAEGS